MGSNSSMLLQKDEVDEICKETGFNAKQVKRLYSRFASLDKDNTGYLDKQAFVRIPELHVNPLRDRIIEVLIDDNGKLTFTIQNQNMSDFCEVFFRKFHLIFLVKDSFSPYLSLISDIRFKKKNIENQRLLWL